MPRPKGTHNRLPHSCRALLHRLSHSPPNRFEVVLSRSSGKLGPNPIQYRLESCVVPCPHCIRKRFPLVRRNKNLNFYVKAVLNCCEEFEEAPSSSDVSYQWGVGTEFAVRSLYLCHRAARNMGHGRVPVHAHTEGRRCLRWGVPWIQQREDSSDSEHPRTKFFCEILW